MPAHTPSSTTTAAAGTQIVLLVPFDSLFVARDVTLLASGSGTEVVNSSGATNMTIHGELHSVLSVAIASSGGGDHINISDTGLVTSTEQAAMELDVGGYTITNAGVISSTNAT